MQSNHMRLKRFDNISETRDEYVWKEGDTSEEFKKKNKAYNQALDMYIPQHNDPEIAKYVKEISAKYKWDVEAYVALAYAGMVDCNQHDMAYAFLDFIKEQYK